MAAADAMTATATKTGNIAMAMSPATIKTMYRSPSFARRRAAFRFATRSAICRRSASVHVGSV
jgi:hypothetical protein